MSAFDGHCRRQVLPQRTALQRQGLLVEGQCLLALALPEQEGWGLRLRGLGSTTLTLTLTLTAGKELGPPHPCPAGARGLGVEA